MNDWPFYRVDELFSIRQGLALGAHRRALGHRAPFLRTSNVYWGRLDLDKLDRMTVDDEELTTFSLRTGDVLVCEGGDIGRTAVLENDLPGTVYQNHIHRLRVRSGAAIAPAFFAAWMEYGWTIAKMFRGAGNKTTIPNLSQSRLGSTLIPVPPIDTQWKASETLASIVGQIASSKAVLRSANAMRSALVNQKIAAWEASGTINRMSLRELCARPQYGLTASATWGGGVCKMLRITDIEQGRVNWNIVPFCVATESQVLDYALREGDVVVARIGATTGKSYLVSSLSDAAVFASYLIRIRVTSALLDPSYLCSFMSSDSYWSQIDQKKGGRLKQGLNIPEIQSITLPLPPMQEQLDFVKILAVIDTKIDVERRRLVALDDLYRACLHDLMTGVLRVGASASRKALTQLAWPLDATE